MSRRLTRQHLCRQQQERQEKEAEGGWANKPMREITYSIYVDPKFTVQLLEMLLGIRHEMEVESKDLNLLLFFCNTSAEGKVNG